jgi:SPP1 family predicted phage head-tail adaptor
MISAGRLRFVALQKLPPAAASTLGLRGSTWTDGQYFRADVRENSAQEQAYADGTAVIRQYELRARWETAQAIGLTESQRIECRGKTYKIRSITNLDERDRVAVIDCEVVQ